MRPETELWLLSELSAARLRFFAPRLDLGTPGTPTFATVISRIPESLDRPVCDLVRGLPVGKDEHYLYPSGTFHLTVLPLAERWARGEEDLPFLDRIRSLVAATRPFEMELRGLRLSPSTVFVAARSLGDAFAAFRARLVRDVPAGTVAPRPRFPSASVGFVNVLRFTGPVDRELRASVRRLHSRLIGRFMVRELQVVRTDKVLSEEATRVLAPLHLGGGG